jgi:hypothetical protein
MTYSGLRLLFAIEKRCLFVLPAGQHLQWIENSRGWMPFFVEPNKNLISQTAKSAETGFLFCA